MIATETVMQVAYVCPILGCGRAFPSLYALRMHFSVHLGSGVCPACGKECAHLKTHILKSQSSPHFALKAALPTSRLSPETRSQVNALTYLVRQTRLPVFAVARCNGAPVHHYKSEKQ